MILRVNNLEPVQITLPGICCYLWNNLVWFLGATVAFISGMAAAHPLPPIVHAVTAGLAMLIVFVKTNPQPKLEAKRE